MAFVAKAEDYRKLIELRRRVDVLCGALDVSGLQLVYELADRLVAEQTAGKNATEATHMHHDGEKVSR